MVYACILTFEKCRDFFENSNGKWTNNPLCGWQPVHWLSESQCTHRVNALFTCWVKAPFTHGVEALFTRVVEALFTQVVKALFTQVVNALFTQEVHAFRGKMSMETPWNKPRYLPIFRTSQGLGENTAKIGHLVKAGCQQNKGFSCYLPTTKVTPSCSLQLHIPCQIALAQHLLHHGRH